MSKTIRFIRWQQLLVRKNNRRISLRWLGVLSLLILIGAIGLLIGVLGGGMIVYANLTQDLPSYAQLSQTKRFGTSSPTQILAWADADQLDTILIDTINDPLNGERIWLALDEFPPILVDATIAAEEPDYWTADFNLWRAGWTLFRNDGQETEQLPIVQQVVRATFHQTNASETRRKINELLLAHRATNTYTSEQILAWYLNTRFYGNFAFGAEAAARVYFDKQLTDLTLAEAAMLAGSSPNINPIDTYQEAKSAQETVLTTMHDRGIIGGESAQTAKTVPLQIASGVADRMDIIAPHFALYVRQELERQFGPEMLLAGGLSVYTALNLDLQGQAECVARAHVNRLSGQIGPALPADELAGCAALAFLSAPDTAVLGVNQRVDNTAVIVLDARTAEIRAMVGSINYWDEVVEGTFNVAVNGQRQPGTIFTPFTYLTALSQGYTAATMVLDVETDFGASVAGESFLPQNRDGRFHGPMRLREALGNDYHVPAIQVASWVGMDKIINTARSLGLTTLAPTSGSYDLSLNLGGGEASLLDLTYAYAVLANMGVMVGQTNLETNENGRSLDPVAIVRVEDQQGNVLYDYYQSVQQRDILTPQLAYLVNDILSDRSARCDAFGCPNIMELPVNRPAAVKTGATNDFRDAWTIGYSPQLVTGVWVGNSDNRVMADVTGVNGAAPIWQAIMAWATQGEPVSLWAQPPGLVETAVCDISGLLATAICPSVAELFIQGTQPTVIDNIYQEFAVNRETGRLATIYTPLELIENRIYKIYPATVAQWALENGELLPPTEFDTINVAESGSEDIQVISPKPLDIISGKVTIRGTARGDDFAYYRLAYYAGLAPGNLQSIVENVTDSKTNERLAVWDTSQLNGLYTLMLTVVREDGRFEEVSIPVTIEN